MERSRYLPKKDSEWTLLEEEDKVFIKPYYKPEHLQKWFVHDTETFIIYVGNSDLTEKIKSYLLQFDKILLNRATINESKLITLDEFLNYTVAEIKQNYSSAGAVQKIMRKKKWFLPLYERLNVPFDSPKIVVNTKNMDVFTFSDNSFYSSGGGSGGQNFIYLKSIFKKTLSGTNTNSSEFTMYINAILNSRLIRFFINNGQFNQLSTEKIADLPVYINEADLINNESVYFKIVQYCKIIIDDSKTLELIRNKFYSYLLGKFITVDISKLKNWQEFSFAEFINELNKLLKNAGKEVLTKKEEFDWIDLFNENFQASQNVKSGIQKNEVFIDNLVFELYRLSKQEIYLIENFRYN